jgi:hypothetical protein
MMAVGREAVEPAGELRRSHGCPKLPLLEFLNFRENSSRSSKVRDVRKHHNGSFDAAGRGISFHHASREINTVENGSTRDRSLLEKLRRNHNIRPRLGFFDDFLLAEDLGIIDRFTQAYRRKASVHVAGHIEEDTPDADDNLIGGDQMVIGARNHADRFRYNDVFGNERGQAGKAAGLHGRAILVPIVGAVGALRAVCRFA